MVISWKSSLFAKKLCGESKKVPDFAERIRDSKKRLPCSEGERRLTSRVKKLRISGTHLTKSSGSSKAGDEKTSRYYVPGTNNRKRKTENPAFSRGREEYLSPGNPRPRLKKTMVAVSGALALRPVQF